MKRFWLVMLSLGLVLAFSASAMAVDVKFSGSYYAAGLYQDKISLRDQVAGASTPFDTYTSTSTAFYYQRLRVGTDFIVSPGLKLVTRFDALERIWGGIRTTPSATYDSSSAATRAESENIAFEIAYISYTSPIGLFEVGYSAPGAWGTVFGNSALNGDPKAKIAYTLPIGPVFIGAGMEKTNDKSYSYLQTTQVANDRDYEKYSLWGVYPINKDIQAGLAFEYRRIAISKGSSSAADAPLPGYYPYYATSYALNPYAKAKFGPIAIEAEATYAWGTAAWEGYNPPESPIGNAYPRDDVKIVNISAYVNVMADFKKVYGGLTLAYVSGDDPGTSDQLEGGIALGGKDFNPTLIMFNYDRTYWVGALNGYAAPISSAGWITGGGTTGTNNEMNNVWFFQGKVGVRPVEALDINASVSFANADKKPASYGGGAASGVLNNAYGWEVDVTGTYKLTNNLSYMLGAGYLFTGDYFQGTSDQNGVNNTYILVNKLTLTF